ncbi:MAG: histidinol-phosphatase [Clostridia bacterium]|nr:histidinol-phosphatase [Clostridia bacterium]
MILADFHTHTTYCDGKHTPREMIDAAIAKGFRAIGFSVHAYTAIDTSYCIPKERTSAYLAELRALRQEYADRITVYIGAEVDAYAETPCEPFDYLIGSAHYVKVGKHYFDVDASPEQTKAVIDTYFEGNSDLYAEAYYEALATVGCHKPDIIGHFDLLTKFNEQELLVDPDTPHYRAVWRACADTLLALHVPFEINTGAISRAWRSTPYPAPDILSYLNERGAQFILSGDAHSAATVGFGFEEAQAYAARVGIRHFVNNSVHFEQK